ncbi:hypothetical protein D3C84_472600 [compost metagenome]
MSDKTRVVFTIKETGEGQPYLTMEFHDAIPGLPDDPPVFDLKPGATMEDAEEVATFLNRNIAGYRPFPSRSRSAFQSKVE